MKKIALSLAGVLAALAFAPQASAVPVFARQTGMACTACHFQHFPLLNSFGRAFKSAGFTMMGAQGKVEGENLDIPDRVNMGVFTTTYYQSESAGVGAVTPGVENAYNGDHWGVPGTGGELSLFIGGRASEFAGFLMEAGLGGGGAAAVSGTNDPATNAVTGSAAAGGLVGAAKLAMLFPVGDARVGLVIHSSTGQGAAYSFELLNTGAANTHKLMGNGGPSDQHVKAFSASQYLGTNTAATGISFVANNNMGFVNLGIYEQAGNDLVGGANGLPLTYMRAAYIADVSGWDVGAGFQNFGGSSNVTLQSPKATVFDIQAQGEVSGMAVGLYASYGTAPATDAASGFTNTFNSSTTNAKSSFNVAGEVGIIPHVSTVQAALRMGKDGAATSNADNAWMLGVTYELAQNIALSFTHTTQFGAAWDNVGGVEAAGKTANTLLLETLF